MRFKQIIENTTAGSVATVAKPMMTQTRENTNVRGLKPVQQVMKGTKKKGPYANSVSEGKVKELTKDLKDLTSHQFQEKHKQSKSEVRDDMKKVNEDDLSEQDLIVIPGQGRLKRTGFVKHDMDQGEHEGHTLKNSLHTIARAASDLDKRLSVQSEFPEWVSEKIGAAKGMMVSVMDYLVSSQEMQHDSDAMNEGSQRVDSLVTDALQVMKGPDVSDAVLALKRVLGDRAYNERRGFYSFYIDQIHDMYNQQNINELSSGLLGRAAQAATDKRNQAMEPKLHDALGGGYMNPLAKHYDNVSQKIDNRAAQVKRKETIQNIASKIASPAVMRKMGMSGVAEGWKDEADDFTGWSNHVKEKLSKAAPEQRLGIAKQLSQIEVKNFGSTIQGGFNRQTGKAQPGLGLTDTVRNIFKSFSQEQQDIHAYNTKDEDGKAGTPDAGKFAMPFGSIFVYGMENATQMELVLMGKAVRMGPDYSKAAQEIYRKTGTLTVDDLKGIRKGFEDNANRFATSIGAQIQPNRPEEPTALTQASLAQQDQRLKENSISAPGIGNNEYKQWMQKIKKYYPTAKVQQRKSPPLYVVAYDKGKEVGVFDIENQEIKFVPPNKDYWNSNDWKPGSMSTPTPSQQSAIPTKPVSALDRVRSRMDSNKGVAEGKIDFAKKLQGKVDKHNKAVVKTKKDVGSRIADIGAGGKEHNEKTDAAWDAAKKKVAESYKKK